MVRKISDWLKIIYYLIALGVTCYGLWSLYQRDIIRWLPIVYGVSSFIVFGLYEKDKAAARNRMWRVPEATLHFFEFMGGWIGAFWGQMICRHKTRKRSYQVMFWLIVTLHFIVWSDFVFFDLFGLKTIIQYIDADLLNKLDLNFLYQNQNNSNGVQGTIEWSNPRH